MDAPAIHASPNALRLRRRVLRGLVIGLVSALVLALLGAMKTDEAPLATRMAYWTAVILPGSLLGIAVQAAMQFWGGLAERRWIEIAVVAVLVSVPHTFMVIVATALFFGMDAITPSVVIGFGSTVLLVALVLTAINYLASEGAEAAVSPPLPRAEPEAGRPADPALPGPGQLPDVPGLIAAKLPVRLRQARLIAIEAEDHYLRIHTDAGSDLVLMRMTDACALLPDAAGARVHRSWWAARGAVAALARRDGRAELTLQSGLTVPVSRAMQASLRERGWG